MLLYILFLFIADSFVNIAFVWRGNAELLINIPVKVGIYTIIYIKYFLYWLIKYFVCLCNICCGYNSYCWLFNFQITYFMCFYPYLPTCVVQPCNFWIFTGHCCFVGMSYYYITSNILLYGELSTSFDMYFSFKEHD